ncbi:MAG: thermonuclease family protein [Caldilineaceae bacterium]|nr:thermonuclease family protein [Caldilineaceae bacterium]
MIMPFSSIASFARLCSLCLIVGVLAACAVPSPASVDLPTSTPAAMAAAPTATATPEPTATTVPTDTPEPTATPQPTNTPTPYPFPPEFVQATAVQAFDGNTIEVQIGEDVRQVRYVLIQAPELEEPLGDVAQARNQELVTGQTVYLEKDRNETDRNGRLLRYVYLADGRMVNEILVREGLAQVAPVGGDVKYEPELRMAQADAMIQGQGSWGTQRATANRNASLRSGPGAEFPAVGTAPVGQLLDIVGRTENGAWYQLADGNWIARFMVDNAPLTIPVTTP